MFAGDGLAASWGILQQEGRQVRIGLCLGAHVRPTGRFSSGQRGFWGTSKSMRLSGWVHHWMSSLKARFRRLHSSIRHGAWDPDRAAEEIRRYLADRRPDLEGMHPYLAAIPLPRSANWALAVHLYMTPERLSLEQIWLVTVPLLQSLQVARQFSRFAVIGVTVHVMTGDKTSERVMHIWSRVNAIEDLRTREAKDLMNDHRGDRFAWSWYVEPAKLFH